MIAVMLEAAQHHAKRQKRSVSPPPLFIDETSSLGGIEDHNDENEDEEEESPHNLQREEALLDRVLSIYEQYEEDSLVKQSHFRSKLTSCGLSKIGTFKKRLQQEKIKYSIFKVLILLLQSDIRLKGHTHQDRVDLIRQVRRVLLDQEVYSVEELKSRFTLLFAVLRRDMFPPCTILLPGTISTACMGHHTSPPLNQEKLNQETQRWMNRLQEAAKESLQDRLVHGDFQQSKDEEESWENMREVWHVWLQFQATSNVQLAVWQETLQHGGNLDSLLWNLAYYLSMDGNISMDG
mmetsp:Transcript_28152/g.46622  ORF Transcript_28152/g.46622 Transcript_28152/m.46622 type:complete len:293 (+) Transcript_28152:217-1095(+)